MVLQNFRKSGVQTDCLCILSGRIEEVVLRFTRSRPIQGGGIVSSPDVTQRKAETCWEHAMKKTCTQRYILDLGLRRDKRLAVLLTHLTRLVNMTTLLHYLLLLAAGSVADANYGVPNLSRRDRAAALRDEGFGISTKTPLPSGPPPPHQLQSRDLKPDSPGVSYHWAGSVVPPPSGENITSVTATMTLPELTAPGDVREGPGGEYFLYVWVGIDGLESVDPGECNSLWQTGFAGQIKNGVTSWWGWVC